MKLMLTLYRLHRGVRGYFICGFSHRSSVLADMNSCSITIVSCGNY